MTTQEKRKNCQLREDAIKIAREYVKNPDSLGFMQKNSKFTAEKVKKYVCNFFIENETIRRVFSQKVDKLISKM